jgi:hypothetical protein
MGSPTNPTVDKYGRTPLPVIYDPAGPSHDVAFSIKNASTPSTLYVERDDSLFIVAASSLTNEIVTINLRVLTAEGRIQDMQFQIRPPNTRAVATQTQILVEGYLLSMSAIANVATSRGETFARCMIVRSGAGIAGAAQLLFADYVTTFVTSGYPNGRVVSPTEGQGLVYGFGVTQPGAGLDWAQLVPVNARWRIRGWKGTLTTSATVANRQPIATVIQGPNFTFLGHPISNIPASQIINVSAGGITPYVTVNVNGYMLPLPPDLLLSGNATFAQSLGCQTVAIQAADQWTNISILVEEWLDNV